MRPMSPVPDIHTDDDGERYVFKDASTGEFVTKQYADDHPDTTFRERVVQHGGIANGGTHREQT